MAFFASNAKWLFVKCILHGVLILNIITTPCYLVWSRGVCSTSDKTGIFIHRKSDEDEL